MAASDQAEDLAATTIYDGFIPPDPGSLGALQLQQGYTVPVVKRGLRCKMERSLNNTDPISIYFSEGEEVWDTPEMKRETCVRASWVNLELNCDKEKPETEVCDSAGNVAKETLATLRFNGRSSCTALVAAMNLAHDEALDEWNNYCKEKKHGKSRNLQVADSCSNGWRKCLYNWFFAGEVADWMNIYNDGRFHMHAHNIVGNKRVWHGGMSGNFRPMAQANGPWERTTWFSPGYVDMYEGNQFSKCTDQDHFFVHIKGVVKGVYGHDEHWKKRTTHSCGGQNQGINGYVWAGMNDWCFFDVDSAKHDDDHCGSTLGSSVDTTRNGWQ